MIRSPGDLAGEADRFEPSQKDDFQLSTSSHTQASVSAGIEGALDADDYYFSREVVTRGCNRRLSFNGGGPWTVE